MLRLTNTRRSLLVLAATTALGLYSIAADERVTLSDIRYVAGLGVICSLMWLFRARGHYENRRIFELGRQAGYDAGFKDGRKVGKPVIVHFPDDELAAAAGDS